VSSSWRYHRIDDQIGAVEGFPALRDIAVQAAAAQRRSSEQCLSAEIRIGCLNIREQIPPVESAILYCARASQILTEG